MHQISERIPYLLGVQAEEHISMIWALVSFYADWWKASVALDATLESETWILKGPAGLVRMPKNPAALVPNEICEVSVPCGGQSSSLPFPGIHPPSPQEWESGFPEDLLTFLAGQLWRAEELLPGFSSQAENAGSEGFLGDRFAFFDRPVVDLWMRALLERLHGHVLPEPPPRFWMTYDVDCLRKWKRKGVLRHMARCPLEIMRGKGWEWASRMREALWAHFPNHDPWYTVPAMLDASQNLRATFFWLGHPRDHLSFRYDVRRPEYARLVQVAAQAGHRTGLHGSPLHADDPQLLWEEKKRLEQISHTDIILHRQHFLRIIPGQTLSHLESIGIQLDSSLGFNACTGFRCGSCLPFPWWDLVQNRLLNLRELPLVVGDWTLHNPSHFQADESLEKLQNLAQNCARAGGILSLDFHELYFSTDYPGHAAFHAQVLRTLLARGWRAWDPGEVFQP
ncbi:MAG TPA: polysaccharide deacetylase family protein [Fibrobacteraceae bacterium]|nr:polysaccharide deacetylase family protein [Fibrobacteraceae bacterium]